MNLLRPNGLVHAKDLGLTLDAPKKTQASGPRDTARRGLREVAWLMDGSPESAILTNPSGVIEYTNPAFAVVTGFSQAEALGRTPSMLRSGHHGREFYDHLWRTLLGGGEFRDVLVNRRKGGDIYREEKSIRPLFDAAGRITHFLSCGRDVSARNAEYERLQRAATHDGLTDLPNRNLFLDRLDQAVVRANRGMERFTVALLDVDLFKHINDSLGHAVGDEALQLVTRRLLACVREVDTVARLGGDEFALLLPGTADAADAACVLQKMVSAFHAPLLLAAHETSITVSVGACVWGVDAADGLSLLRLADAAMYAVKRRGGNGVQVCGGVEPGGPSDAAARDARHAPGPG